MKKAVGSAFLCALCLVHLVSTASADARLPAIVGDHMMLQQHTGAPIWGWAEPGESVTVTGSWSKQASATADANGRWQVNLETPSYGGPYTVSIQAKNEITLNDVMIGEVWLCAGQSNMGWKLAFTMEGKEDSAAADYPDFRIFRPQRAHSHQPQDDCIAEWTPCTPETAGTCSAVSFYFAEKLRRELNLPVGIVLQPYAGTPIEGWMPKEIQLGDPRTRQIVEKHDALSPASPQGQEAHRLAASLPCFEEDLRQGLRPAWTFLQVPPHRIRGALAEGESTR